MFRAVNDLKPILMLIPNDIYVKLLLINVPAIIAFEAIPLRI